MKRLNNLFHALALTAALFAIGASKAQAADVHVCATVEANLTHVYHDVEEAESQDDIDGLKAAIIQAESLGEQRGVLLGGVDFLIEYADQVGHLPPVELFVVTGKQVCEANFGQIADRKNT